MTDAEQNIAIAKVCGWEEPIKQIGYTHPDGWWMQPDKRQMNWRPSYTTDLNAMHEAVLYLRKTGDQFQWLQYQRELFKVIWGRDAQSYDCIIDGQSFGVVNATSQQRAEAFLQTLNLWKD